MRILIAGCGDVGNVLANCLLLKGHTVFGLKRNISSLPAGVIPIAADLTDAASLNGLPNSIEQLVFMPTPAERTSDAYKAIFLGGWNNLWKALDSPPQRSLMISSTAVYGQSDGSRVDENSPTEPVKFNGRVLLEMEALGRAASQHTIITRLSGIYGPGREALVRLAASGAAVQNSPPLFTNRIYREDAAAALEHLLFLDRPADLYLVADDSPVAKYDVVSWLAEQLGRSPPEAASDPRAGSGKRISNLRLRDSGLNLKFPDYRAGYAKIMEQRILRERILQERNKDEFSG